MHKLPVVPNHVDDRGTIADLLCERLDSATVVTTREGALRGNHYHRRTHQWGYVVSGALRVSTRYRGGSWEGVVRAGELMYSPPLEQHAWQALEDTVVLVLTRGPRSGPGYEDDTYRLAPDRRLIR